MTNVTTRRDWLQGATAFAAAAALPRGLLGQPAADALRLVELGGDVAVIAGGGANVTVADGVDGLVVVDGGFEADFAVLRGLLEQRWPGRPVATVFNTNWRPEHTGANALLRGAGARILAHENTKLWMGAKFAVEWSGERHERVPKPALPTETFYTGGAFGSGARRVEYGHLPRAHTDGDAYVFFPDANVLAVSDLLAVGGYPIVDYVTGGWIGGMVDATRALLEVANGRTRIIPAAGEPQSRSSLQTQLELCVAARDAVAGTYRQGGTLADFVAVEPTAGFESGRGDPKLFLSLVYEGAWGHVRELRGII
jgi:glyoxylase-like metal-dependent hydrolase (beta-lactamase superfamily II)